MGDLLHWIFIGVSAFLFGVFMIMITPIIVVSIDWIIDGRITAINMHQFMNILMFALRAGLPIGFLLGWLLLD